MQGNTVVTDNFMAGEMLGMANSTIHERIKEQRMRLGMSLEQVAEKLNVTYQTVQQWENGRAGPKRTRIGQLAALLGVTEQYLMTGSDPAMGDMLENQALTIFRGLPPALQDVAVQQLQALYSASNPGKKDAANPYGGKPPPKK